MAKVRTRFPTVFVGHPFTNRFPVKKFRKLVKELPFKVIYGNTDIQTEHLLKIMKREIGQSDYSLFDLSDWSPNVALELGLAEGLRNKPIKPYYILLNSRRSKDVPSDVKGIQRLEYTRYDYQDNVGLGYVLVHYILKKEYWVKKIISELGGREKLELKLRVALKMLAHLRDHQRLFKDNIDALARGSRLRKNDHQEIIETLLKLKLIKKKANSVYVACRKMF